MTEPAAGPAPRHAGVVSRAAALGRWRRGGLAMLAGALMTAGHPPIQLPWMLFAVVPVIVVLALAAPTVRAAAWVGWAAAFGYFLTGLHWLGHPFLVEPEKYGWLLPLGVTAMPIGFGLLWGLTFAIGRRFAPAGLIAGTVWLCSLWTLIEVARTYMLTGFPWALPGYVWVDTPAMQAGAWVGPHGMTWLTLLVTAMPGVSLIAGGAARLAGAVGLLLGVTLWSLGVARVPGEVAAAPDAPVIRVVQPNAPQHLKWQPGHREVFYNRLLEMTAAPPDPALGPPRIVVWPEASVHFVPAANPEEVARIAKLANGAWVFVGALHGERTVEGTRWFNSMVPVRPDGTLGERYDKHHLVPFGEYLPLGRAFDLIGVGDFFTRGGFEAGPGPRTLVLGNLPPVSVLICYEAIFPQEVVGETRPAWLFQPTNDAWFGSFAGPHQHYAQARIRAIEQGLPLIRAANTGISAAVDPYGHEIAASRLHIVNYFDVKLPAALPPTLYSRTGDALAIVLILAGLLLCRLPGLVRRRG